MKSRIVAPAALVVVLGLAMSACTSPSSQPTGDRTISVVASTNVYGSIAHAIGGDLVKVTSIIDDPSKDPHEYEANGQNQLALSTANLIIENGGGYDDFVDTLLTTANNKAATLLNVAEISGYDQHPAVGEFNEHLWYDFPTVNKLADKIVSALSDEDPDNSATYASNGDKFVANLKAFEGQEDALKAKYAGGGVAITEPVPLYLLKASGLDNLTPEEFSQAIEEDTDVPPAVLQRTLALFSSKRVKLLAYNAQTTGPETEAVLKAAKDNGVPVVPVTETLPAGKTYIQWMQSNLDAVSSALAG